MVDACIVTYAVCASVCMCVCSCAVPEQREERAEGVHYRSLCGSDCPLLWESGNSTLQSRGLVTRWERGKEKKKGKRKKTQREREAMKTAKVWKEKTPWDLQSRNWKQMETERDEPRYKTNNNLIKITRVRNGMIKVDSFFKCTAWSPALFYVTFGKIVVGS